jgi:hypothetical protein
MVIDELDLLWMADVKAKPCILGPKNVKVLDLGIVVSNITEPKDVQIKGK